MKRLILATAVAALTVLSTAGTAEARREKPTDAQIAERIDTIRLAFAARGASDADQLQAVYTVCRETRFVNGLVSPTKDYGLLQLNRKAQQGRVRGFGWSMEDVRWNVAANATVAADLWAEVGWGPWTTKLDGRWTRPTKACRGYWQDWQAALAGAM